MRCTVLLVVLFALLQTALRGCTGQLLVDCYPEAGSSEEGCTARGCVWATSSVQNLPWCTFPPDSDYGYYVAEEIDEPDGPLLRLLRNPGQLSFYGSDVEEVHLKVVKVTENIIRLKFFDPNVNRYEVPLVIDRPARTSDTDLYRFHYSNSSIFGLTVSRSTNGKTLLNTETPGFIYADQYLQVTTTLASSFVYGFGEHYHQRYLHDLNWRTWTMFTRDMNPKNEYNLYGVHPFYLSLEEDGSAHGVLLVNSNAMEVTLQPYPALTYRAIGGILDFYVFLGPTPEDVVKQVASIRGHPIMPPYWALGFQLCRWGYTSTADVRLVVDNMRAASIPHETQVVDIDHMDNKMDFTLGTGFENLPDLVDDLHAHDQKFIMIVDAAIASQPGKPYKPLDDGMVRDVFIKTKDGDILEGSVWPGNTYYPDFTHPDSESYWHDQLSHFYYAFNVTYDGVWIDMNEPSSFSQGSTVGCENNTYNYPPFPTEMLGAEQGGMIFDKTICMDAVQSAGIHYNLHSLYGHHMSKATNGALKTLFPGVRPFVLTRSQYTGSGRYTSHWLGDNDSTWESLRASIPASLEYNLFGIVHNGADICGFGGDTTEELCIRWIQLGSFYTFSRNHNTIGAMPQDPPSLGENVVKAHILALTERYRLLPYLYTLLYEAEKSGATVARPLLHEFPLDTNTYDINYQFLWGSGLLISPVVYLSDVQVDAYFPAPARWFDYYTGAEISGVGSTVTLDAPLDGTINLHVRGGIIIPTQEPALTTTESRLNAAGLIVALNENQFAQGSLFWDDGITLGTALSGQYDYYDFIWEQDNLEISLSNDGYTGPELTFDSLIVYGLEAQPDVITVNSHVVSKDKMNFNFDNKMLKITGLGLKLGSN